MCYRCGAKGKHFSDDCFAKNRVCHGCEKKDHIIKICQSQSNTSTQHHGGSCKFVGHCTESCHSEASRTGETTVNSLHRVRQCNAYDCTPHFPTFAAIGSGSSAQHLPANQRSACGSSDVSNSEQWKTAKSPVTNDAAMNTSVPNKYFDDSFFNVNAVVEPVTLDPFSVSCKLNNVDISFQLDSGASVSTISYYDALKVQSVIKPTSFKVTAYNGAIIDLIGEIHVQVVYENRTFTHKFLVVSGNKVNLMGRDLCKTLGIKILLPNIVNFTQDILSEFREYLSESFEFNVSETVHLEVDSNAKPI